MLIRTENKQVVVVLGGYGNFGKRICHELAQNNAIRVIIAGRDQKKALLLQAALKKEFPQCDVETLVLDRKKNDFKEKIINSKATILVHTAGPFQNQDYCVANFCIEAKIHYVDIADSREYVVNIKTLDEDAQKNDVVVISGASSVPGLASTIIDGFASKFSTLLNIDFGISPGNKVERGLGTLRSVFDYIGKPFLQLNNGKWQTVYGWQQMHRQYFGDNVGMRWQSCCDVPDLELLPQRYPKLLSAKFYAGLEIGFLHLMLWKMSWLVRWKLIRNLSYFAGGIEKISFLFKGMGSPKGGMYVHLYGTDFQYQPYEIQWNLVAESAHGLNIPIIPALIIIKKMLNQELESGARPCTNLFTLEEFDVFAKKWNIYHTTSEKQM